MTGPDFPPQGLDERTTVLALSTLFHQKAEQYRESIPKWGAQCELEAPSSSDSSSSANNSQQTKDINSLEAAIHRHQSVYETMCQSYTEVHSTSKKLLYQLDHLVQMCNSHTHVMSGNSTDDGRKHVRQHLFLLEDVSSLTVR